MCSKIRTQVNVRYIGMGEESRAGMNNTVEIIALSCWVMVGKSRVLFQININKRKSNTKEQNNEQEIRYHHGSDAITVIRFVTHAYSYLPFILTISSFWVVECR